MQSAVDIAGLPMLPFMRVRGIFIKQVYIVNFLHHHWLCFKLENKLSRDGVSEGQFYQVLLYELDAIRKVCFVLSCLAYCPDTDVKQTKNLCGPNPFSL